MAAAVITQGAKRRVLQTPVSKGRSLWAGQGMLSASLWVMIETSTPHS